jgi:hypothetical protein
MALTLRRPTLNTVPGSEHLQV